MQFRLTVLFLAAAVTGLVAQSAPPRITPEQARDFEGKIVTVCGGVVSAGCNPQTHETTLLFHPYPTSRFRAKIPASARPADDQRFEERFIQRNVCVTGLVTHTATGDEITVGDDVRFSFAEGPSPFAPHAHWPCEATVVLPKVTKEVKPFYTPAAMARNRSGTVLIQVVIESNGRPGAMRLLSSLDPDLDQSALTAVSGWRFTPGTFRGEPAAIVATVELTFMLRK